MEGQRVVLAKPQTFMNVSGAAVAPLFRKHCGEPGDLVVVHDDLDLPPGTVRLKRGGGTGGHNGLRSLRQELGNADFLRIRVGVGRPPPGVDPADYVLAPAAPGDRDAFEEAVGAACGGSAGHRPPRFRQGHDAPDPEGAKTPHGIPGGEHTPCSRRQDRGLDQPKGGTTAR